MGLYEVFTQYRLLIETLYILVILTSCIVIYLKARKLYSISMYEGLGYFGRAFLFYAIGFMLRYAINIALVLSQGNQAFYVGLAWIIMEYFLSMAGFYLVYSMIWKRFDKVSLKNKVLLLHAVAAAVGVIDFLWKSQSVMFIVQIALFSYAVFINYANYSSSKKKGFIQIYFIITVLVLIGWIVNYLAIFLYSVFPPIILYIYATTTAIFLLFLYGAISQKTRRTMLFTGLFALIIFLSSKVKVFPIQGTKNSYFRLYEFIGPCAGGFLGPVIGGAVVYLTSIFNSIISGKVITLISLLTLTPNLTATIYFGMKSRLKAIIPLCAIILFLLHPAGAWFYALLWAIPVASVFIMDRLSQNIRLLMLSLSATLAAHSVGTVVYVYTSKVTISPQEWLKVLPATLYERTLFALGIAASYIIIKTVMELVVEKADIKTGIETIVPKK